LEWRLIEAKVKLVTERERLQAEADKLLAIHEEEKQQLIKICNDLRAQSDRTETNTGSLEKKDDTGQDQHPNPW
jgi:hypothetical protein